MNVIEEAERITYNKRILKSSNKSKTTWSIISELSVKQHSANDIRKISIEGTPLTNIHDIAEAFNKYYSSIIDKLAGNNLENKAHNSSSFTYSYLNQHTGYHYSPLVFKTFSTHEIKSVIKSLKTKNSFGYDGISTKLLKISANYICSPLTCICNKSISTGIFPE